jgi:hypothetical protein
MIEQVVEGEPLDQSGLGVREPLPPGLRLMA